MTKIIVDVYSHETRFDGLSEIKLKLADQFDVDFPFPATPVTLRFNRRITVRQMFCAQKNNKTIHTKLQIF